MEVAIKYLLNMSLYGSIAILAVILLRFVLKRFPKRYTILFWLVPAVRLLCPVNFNSIISILNLKVAGTPVSSSAVSGTATEYGKVTVDQTLVDYANQMKEKAWEIGEARGPASHSIGLETVLFSIWIVGLAAVLMYVVVKTIKLVIVLRNTKRVEGTSYIESNLIETSFVVGVINQSIWLPTGLDDSEKKYILLHEKIHLKNHDNITKLLGMFIVCVHWFNPFFWIAYRMMCSDLEMRCDEEVINLLGNEVKKSYCTSIVCRAMKQKRCRVLPLTFFAQKSFGGMEVKMRIKNMLKNKVSSKVVAIAVSVLAIGAIAGVSSAAVRANEVDAAEQPEKTSSVKVEDQVEPDTQAPEEAPEEVTEAPEPEEASEGGLDIPLAETASTDEHMINFGYEVFTIPEDAVPSDEFMLFSKSFNYKDYTVLANAVKEYEDKGFTVTEEPAEFIDQDGNIQTGKEIYTVYLNDIVENEKIYSGSIAFRSLDFGKQYFDESDFDGEKYVQEINMDDGFRVYRCYDPTTYLMYDFVYMDGKYASADNGVEVTE